MKAAPLDAPFLTAAELAALGLRACGEDVLISAHALVLHPERVAIGSHVRIDPLCFLSAGPDGITIGDYVHLATGACLFGGGGRILLENFAGLSARVLVYTASDDYRDGWLTNPTVPDDLRRVSTGDVVLGEHAIVGAGSVLLPGATLEAGCAVGALSLVRRTVPSGAVVAGMPARTVGSRDVERLRKLEAELSARRNPTGLVPVVP